jgi:ferric-dicitrate binding protein FerR (iron transport regulator)
VHEAGQPTALARRIEAWMIELTSGNEDPNDAASADRHLELLYQKTDAVQRIEEVI